MTDKATVEVPAPQGGTIQEIRAKEGDVVPVGEVIFVLGGATAAPAASAPASDGDPAVSAASARVGDEASS